MLGRLPKSRSLLVNKGFKNSGISNILPKMPSKRGIPCGVSIGATNKPYDNLEAMIEDAFLGFKEADTFQNFDYYELNISCPNLINIQNLPQKIDSPVGFKAILEKLNGLRLSRPVFVKMPLERSLEETKELLEVAVPYSFVKGFIFANLVKNRENPAFDPEEIKNAGKGNFSGKPVSAQSDALISFAYQKYGQRFTIIGVGGIFTAEDAYRKITLGASLVQLITGMIYMGPQSIGEINAGLVKLLHKNGFKNISEAVGANVRG
jgi:dihydroorotate dehydrogenase